MASLKCSGLILPLFSDNEQQMKRGAQTWRWESRQKAVHLFLPSANQSSEVILVPSSVLGLGGVEQPHPIQLLIQVLGQMTHRNLGIGNKQQKDSARRKSPEWSKRKARGRYWGHSWAGGSPTWVRGFCIWNARKHRGEGLLLPRDHRGEWQRGYK